MRQRDVGILIILFSLVLGIIIFIFNNALNSIVSASCDHGDSCSMWTTINTQTTIGIVIMVVVLVIGLYFIYLDKKNKKVNSKLVEKKDESYSKELSSLKKDEQEIFKLIINQKSIYQSSIVKQTNFSKVKVTRILDSLENKQLIIRKRRGMTNLVELSN